MNEHLELIWRFAMHSWHMWGALAFVLAPFGLTVVAIWDFIDWKNRKKNRDDCTR